MSNVFGYGNNGETFYFQLPMVPLKAGRIKDWSNSELRLLMHIYIRANYQSSVAMAQTNKQIEDETGLCAASITTARRALVERRILDAQPIFKGRSITGYRYILLNKDGEPMDPRPRRVNKTGFKRSKRSLESLTTEERARYYQHYFPNDNFARVQLDVCCPFHNDTYPSMSINTETGQWYCQASESEQLNSYTDCGGGGILAFEKKKSGCNIPQALRNIAKIINVPEILQERDSVRVAVYDYCDEHGEIVYQIQRFDPKAFITTPTGVRKRLLYRLPEVLAASTVIVVEGEKDVDRLSGLKLVDSEGKPVAVTCNSHGALRWKPELSPFLKGKSVIVIADLDTPKGRFDGCGGKGEEHAKRVVEAVRPYALSVKLVRFSYKDFEDASVESIEKGGDVFDYLETHSVDELLKLIGVEGLRQEHGSTPSNTTTQLQANVCL